MPKHPFLWATADQLSEARRRAATDERAGRALADVLNRAKGGLSLELPEFERDWYEGKTKADWGEIYPEVSEHTTYAPTRLARPAAMMALAHWFEPNPEYVAGAKRVLDHFARNYDFRIEHWDVGMNYAGWGMQLLAAHDLLYGESDDEEREVMKEFFLRLGAAVGKNDRLWIRENPGGAFNNHYTWHKWALACLGLFYDQPEWVEYALEGPMGFRELLENGLMDDGFWFESSTGYHFVPLYALVPTAHALRNAGHEVDLFNAVFAGGRCMRQLFEAPIAMAFPDLSLPAVGDCYGRVPRLAGVEFYADAQAAYEDGLSAWVLQRRDPGGSSLKDLLLPPPRVEPEIPSAASRTWPEHGYVMLREIEGTDYWGSDSLAAFVSYDRSSIHANSDRLSLLLFGRGRRLIANAESTAPGHAFSSDVQRQLNRTTLVKNTVMVDKRSQRGNREVLRLAEFSSSPEVKTTTVVDDEGWSYEGVRQSRSVALTADYVLDVFQVASASEHEYTYLVHLPPEWGSGSLSVAATSAEWSGPSPEYAWLREVRMGASDEQWTGDWEQDGTCLRLTMLAVAGTRVVAAQTPSRQDQGPPPWHLIGAERFCRETIFVVLYQAEKGDLPEARARVSELDADRIAVEVKVGDTVRRHQFGRLHSPE